MYESALIVKKSKKGTGNGVFTEVDIPARTPIIEISGQIKNKESDPGIDPSQWLQISHKLFIGPSGRQDDYINHSCDPNSYLRIVGKRAILQSLYVIKAGSEITFDYSTSSTDDISNWSMICFCGSYKCRKVISGYQYLDPALQEEYKNKGMIPMFLTNPIFKGT